MTSSHIIHRIEGRVMPVNAYLVEGREGVVLIDGMLTVSDARAVAAALDRLQKPLLGALITHAHPDHYAGLAHIVGSRGVPIMSTAGVRRAIERDDAIKNAVVGPMMGSEWPTERIFPSVDLQPGATVRLGDLAFSVIDLGPGESPADSLFVLEERAVFTGDVVYAGMHAYLADGHAEEWLAALGRLARDLPAEAVLYVGHGAPGGRVLIDEQRGYVRAFVAASERHHALSPEARVRAVSAEMKARLPTDALAFLMELSVEPFAAKLDVVRSALAERSGS